MGVVLFDNQSIPTEIVSLFALPNAYTQRDSIIGGPETAIML